MKGLQNISYEEQQWEGLFSLEKEDDQVRPHPSPQVPEGRFYPAEGMLFSPTPAARELEQNSLKLRQGSFRQEIRNKYFTYRVKYFTYRVVWH